MQTITGNLRSLIKRAKEILIWFNCRPKFTYTILVFIIFYMPWAHLNHSYGGLAKHFLRDGFFALALKGLGFSGAIGLSIYLPVTGILTFMLFKFLIKGQ